MRNAETYAEYSIDVPNIRLRMISRTKPKIRLSTKAIAMIPALRARWERCAFGCQSSGDVGMPGCGQVVQFRILGRGEGESADMQPCPYGLKRRRYRDSPHCATLHRP